MSSSPPLHVEPQLSVSAPSPEPLRAPPARLFTLGQILVASLLSTALAGAILYGLNERRLGRPRAMWLPIGLGVVAMVLVVTLSFVVDGDQHHLTWIGHALGFGMWDIAKRQQGVAIEAHLASGGRRGSIGGVIAAIFGTAAIVIAMAVGAYLLSNPFGEQLKLGDSSVYYTKGVTVEQARKVGR
jgi:hypothetical protein